MAIDVLLADLERLGIRERRRALAPRRGLDFASNDYLGLAGSVPLRRAVSDALERGVAIGSGGSRLLRGNAPAPPFASPPWNTACSPTWR